MLVSHSGEEFSIDVLLLVLSLYNTQVLLYFFLVV